MRPKTYLNSAAKLLIKHTAICSQSELLIEILGAPEVEKIFEVKFGAQKVARFEP